VTYTIIEPSRPFLINFLLILFFVSFALIISRKSGLIPALPILSAFFVRLAAAAFMLYVIALPSRYIFDQSIYDEYSLILSENLNIQNFPFPKISKLSSFSYIFTGANELSFRIFVISSSILGLIAVFFTLNKLYSALSPYFFWIIAFFPSLIFWQSFHLKDGILAACAAGTIFAAVSFNFKKGILANTGLFLLMLSTLGLTFFLRPYWAVACTASLGAGVLYYVLSRAFPQINWTLPAALAATLLLAAAFFIFKSPGQIALIHNNMTIGAETKIYEGLIFNSVFDIIYYLPKGIAAFLFMPYPWIIQPSIFHVLAALESLLCLILIPAGFYELLILSINNSNFKNSDDFNSGDFISGCPKISFNPHFTAAVLITFILCLFFFHGIIEGNAGTAFRHRIIILQFLIPLGAIRIYKYLMGQ
jgi:hypothetical protein